MAAIPTGLHFTLPEPFHREGEFCYYDARTNINELDAVLQQEKRQGKIIGFGIGLVYRRSVPLRESYVHVYSTVKDPGSTEVIRVQRLFKKK